SRFALLPRKLWQVARSSFSRFALLPRKLCPVHRGFIAMSGSSDQHRMDITIGPCRMVSSGCPRSVCPDLGDHEPWRLSSHTPIWQVARSSFSRFVLLPRKLCTVHRGFIAMSGSSDQTSNGYYDRTMAGGPFILFKICSAAS